MTPALLVVDDSEDNRYTLTRLLGREGYTDVTTADDAHQAMARLRERRFDVVRLDIRMPEISLRDFLEPVPTVRVLGLQA